jgi:hypothetical protein
MARRVSAQRAIAQAFDKLIGRDARASSQKSVIQCPLAHPINEAYQT